MKGIWWGLVVLSSLCLTACGDDGSNVVQGYIEGGLTYVTSGQSGYLSELSVSRGQDIKTGEPVFSLSGQPESDQVDEAAANLEQAEATLADLKLGERPDEIQEIEAQIKATDAAIDYYRKEVARYSHLAKQSFASQESLDQNKYKYDENVARKEELQASLKVAKLGSRENQIKAQEQVVLADKAALAAAKWSAKQKQQQAMVGGIVYDTYYKEGEWVASGQSIASIFAPQDIRVIFFVPETKLAQIKVGQSVQFSCDSCKPGRATISYISSENEYTPPVIFSNDMRDKLVYEVKADLDKGVALNYHPGQPVDVTLPEGM